MVPSPQYMNYRVPQRIPWVALLESALEDSQGRWEDESVSERFCTEYAG